MLWHFGDRFLYPERLKIVYWPELEKMYINRLELVRQQKVVRCLPDLSSVLISANTIVLSLVFIFRPLEKEIRLSGWRLEYSMSARSLSLLWKLTPHPQCSM